MTSRQTIGGALDPHRLYFHVLDREQQAEAIRRMARLGYSECTIASATGLSREFVMRVLAERTEDAA